LSYQLAISVVNLRVLGGVGLDYVSENLPKSIPKVAGHTEFESGGPIAKVTAEKTSRYRTQTTNNNNKGALGVLCVQTFICVLSQV
jgi:hypothetical protein